jgi:hypothetical protein
MSTLRVVLIPIGRQRSNKRHVRALELRDLALAVVRARGTWRSVQVGHGAMHLLGFDSGSLSILHRTPFQRLPQCKEISQYLAALYSLGSPANLPYGLDLWSAGKKLNVQWTDGGPATGVSYKKGDWERELEGRAAEVGPSG